MEKIVKENIIERTNEIENENFISALIFLNCFLLKYSEINFGLAVVNPMQLKVAKRREKFVTVAIIP
jgi:short subunit dehydrogenase-like uncharacterized protein